MTGTTWSHLAGDTSEFAVEFAFHPDPDDASSEGSSSWGSLAIHAHGRNLCFSTQYGESVVRVYWHLLPFIEWVIGKWNILFHEERLPEAAAVATAADFDAFAGSRPLSHDDATWDRLERWQAWLERHSLRSGLPGAVVPDIYFRRVRDRLEISVGGSLPPGTPRGIDFPYRGLSSTVDISIAATALYEGISLALDYLDRRGSYGQIVQRLKTQLNRLANPTNDDRNARLSYLVPPGRALDAVLEDAGMSGGQNGFALALASAPASALLFGSYAPTIKEDDLSQLVRCLKRAKSDSVDRRRLEEHRKHLHSAIVLTGYEHPGEQGGQYGEAFYGHMFERGLASDSEPHLIEPRQILDELGITETSVVLSDRRVRGLSLVGPTHNPLIAVNAKFWHGEQSHVQRFTIAHELAHLLLDWERAHEWGVTSGPWAPLAVEQRANGFAAALLMPAEVLDAVVPQGSAETLEPRDFRAIASRLRVSGASLIDRLCNVGSLDRASADALKEEFGRPWVTSTDE